MMNHDIFISYSSKQKSIADGVCHYLEENGFKCWMAPRDIPIGIEYGDLIEEAIKTTKVVILVFSEAASISKWVKGEINVAFTEDKPILPFRVDETEIKGGFRVMLNQMHWIDAFPQYVDRLPDLLSSICGLLGRQPRKMNAQRSTAKSGEVVGEKPIPSEKTNTINGHEYVDLGLPSGTLWATCNVGATKPEEFGDYYAWGEINTKKTYKIDTYRYSNGNYLSLTKYCTKSGLGITDNLTTLQGGDDSATTYWGGGWRMPSEAQWNELLENTTNKWTIQNGVNGRLFTAKNGQTLFLPAAGDRNDESVLNLVGVIGNYWSNSLYTDNPDLAWDFWLASNGCGVSRNSRVIGLSVRAVHS